MHLTTANKRAFTLIEIVVAIGLLAIVLMFAGSIFKSSIGSYRAATAQAEIMQKLRAITEQLNSDFKGLRKDAPTFIWFQKDPNNPNRRLDQIMFFADGDFQSTRLYYGIPKVPSSTGAPVVSNTARIQYGHARVYSTSQADYVIPENQQNENTYGDRFLNIDHRTLARRQHLLTADPDIFYWPRIDSFQFVFIPEDNNNFEHDKLSLSQWQAITAQDVNVERVTMTCFNSTNLDSRPSLNFGTGDGLYMLMTEGVGSFSIQWGYMFTNAGQTFIYWWPSNDPDGNPATLDSDFDAMVSAYAVSSFGFYFNTAKPPAPTNLYWFSSDGAKGLYYPDPLNLLNPFNKPTYPQALKFTFTIYDSKGVFKEGQTFTHIVYLGD